MTTDSEVSVAAQHVNQLEQRGMALTSDWYANYAQSDAAKVNELHRITKESEATLQSINKYLSARLLQMSMDDEARNVVQLAYNVSQELTQSRDACISMIEAIKSHEDHAEYHRTLAIKEKAAAKLAGQLSDMVLQLEGLKPH